MINNLFQRESVPVLEAALSFAHQRHTTIMNNIANVDTPYYKRQSVPEGQFREALESALTERRELHPTEFSMRDSQDIHFAKGGRLPVANVLPGKEAGPERHDENSIVVEKEMADLAKNTIFTETLQRLLKKKYTMMQAALRDRVA
ncbi:MAG: flagellar basal body rod protein FlgB [Planctomycetota bacterium]|jgi:flagellar basal-body rod protein FlgB